jgi:fructose-specific PTS system IIC-like component
MVGGAAGSITSLLLNAANHAPWGGLIVLPVVSNRIGYVIAVAVGIAVTAAMILLLKKEVKEDAVVESNDNSDEIDIDFE